MDCCYPNEKYSVSPILLTSCTPVKFCDSTPLYIPCVPSCNKKQVVYCCEKPRAKKVCYDGDCDYSCLQCSETQPQKYCPTCHQPTCAPEKTKYIMPCYRYEDGRIEQYVPKVHGRLPSSAYRRNGIQDQINGYRGAIRYLCALEKENKRYLCTSVEPIRRLYPKITKEMFPAKKKLI